MADSKVKTDEAGKPVGGAPGDGMTQLAALTAQVEALTAEREERDQAINDLKTQLSSAKTDDDFQAAQSQFDKQMGEMRLKLTRANIMREHQLPDDVTDLLVGGDEAALKASAEKLVAFRGQPVPVVGHDTKHPGSSGGGAYEKGAGAPPVMSAADLAKQVSADSLIMR